MLKCSAVSVHGGSASISGIVFHLLPTLNETSLTSVNFEDRAH